jgi:Type IV secretion-system coupling protein DNA-binding domain
MKIEDLLRWPTNSSDPGINFVIIVVIAMLGIAALVFSAVLLIPLAIGFGIFKFVQLHASRPTPTSEIAAAAQQRVIAANFPDTNAFLDGLSRRLVEAWRPSLPNYGALETMLDIAETLYDGEGLNNPLPPAPPSSPIEEGRYRDQLLAQARRSADAPATLAAFSDALSRSLAAFHDALPPMARSTPQEIIAAEDGEKPTLATVPIIDLLPDVGRTVWGVAIAFYTDEVKELGLFAGLKHQLDLNDQLASQGSRHYIPPYEYKGSAREIVRAYLGHTPLAHLFDAQVPFTFTDRQRYEHMHVIGGSGHGKTQLLQHLIFHDLSRDEPPALIVIDSQGDMLRKIERLDLFAREPLADRLVIIDPEDVEHPPALNMFDMSNARLAGYSRAHREQIEAGVIELYNYVFGALAAELTQKQGTAFAFVSRLMLTVPGATIHTLRELMEDDAPSIDRSPFADHIARLDPTAQAFFQNQFFTRAFAPTKQQIARRLYGVLQVPAFDRMFSAPTNKLDMFEAIQNGRIVLINTSKAQLKNDASALFGRYMIALAMRAVFERVAVTKHDPAFLIVDEAAEYFDENLETLLSQARKYNMGVLFAHQHLDQLSPALRSSVAANTSIKLAGGISDRDARTLAADMRTLAEFISSTRKRDHSTEFACYVRNMTESAVKLSIPFGTLEAAPRMSRDALADLLARNRERYAAGPDTPRPAAADHDEPPPAASQAPAAEANSADDWRS